MTGTVPGRPRAVKIGIAAAIVVACLFLAAIPLSPLNIIAALVFLATHSDFATETRGAATEAPSFWRRAGRASWRRWRALALQVSRGPLWHC